MATIAPTGSAKPLSRAAASDRFFFHVALFCLAVGVIGFAPTYWLQLAAGTVDLPPLIHLHGLVFTAWLALLVAQSWLAARGNLRRHRAWGLAGISLATLVFAVGMAAAIASLHHSIAIGYGDEARAFLIGMVTGLVGFALAFAAAIANRRRPEWHKRLIVVATFFVLPPAAARFFFLAQFGMHPGLTPGSFPPPPIAGRLLQASLLLDCVIVIAMVRDRRDDGKVHPAWLWGLSALAVVQLGRVPLATSAAWFAFADWLAQF